MLCDLCHKNNATVHLTEIVDNQMSELHLCDECARKKSMQMEQQFGLSDLLAGLVDYGKQISSSEKESGVLRCGRCGLTYEDFKKIGRLGCGECYCAFSKQLGPLLRRIHGASMHVGKAPFGKVSVCPSEKKSSDEADSIDVLKEKLKAAIAREEFEEAARLRDAIKMQEEGSKNKIQDKKKGNSK